MGMTMGEKILAKSCNKKSVTPGEIITSKIDLCMTNDATTHISINIFNNKLKNTRVFDPDKVVFIIDHNIPSESDKTSYVQSLMRNFARSYGLHFLEGKGVCHQLMIERFVKPGQIVVAADSHTCSYGALGAFGIGVGSTDFTAAMSTGEIWLMVPETIKIVLNGTLPSNVYARDLILKIIGDIGANGANYKIMEFCGDALDSFTLDDRIVLCNMAVEAGAKTALMPVNHVINEFEKSAGRSDYICYASDEDAIFCKTLSYNLEELEPMVAKPHFVDNVAPVSQIGEVKVDECFIGSCNNGRIEELREAAKLLKDRKVADSVRLYVVPASADIYLKAIEEGLVHTFTESGATVLNPNCSVCWGGCQGVIGKGEVLVSTGTRNFKGRAGHSESFVYLASATTVAATAVTGKITDARGLL